MCTICNTTRDAPLEETWQLAVAIPPTPQSYPLEDLIAHYAGTEKDVNVECNHCGQNTPHDSRPSYLQTPRVLVIQALRFLLPKPSSALVETGSNSEAGKRVQKKKVVKNASHITFPLLGLDMTSHLRNESMEEEVYDLFGVVEHIGRKMDGGHYIAYVRGKDSTAKDIWWKCNDAKCWMVSPEMVSSVQGYIWFYERRAERGVVPVEWGPPFASKEVGHQNCEMLEDVSLQTVKDVGLPTPESDERGVDATGRSWTGRLRTTCTESEEVA